MVKEASPLTKAIREALAELGHDALTQDIRAHVELHYPDLAKETAKGFSTRVSQNRARTPAAPVATDSTFGRLALADRFYCYCGANIQHARKVLELLDSVNVADLRAALEKFARLIEKTGGLERAREVLDTLKE